MSVKFQGCIYVADVTPHHHEAMSSVILVDPVVTSKVAGLCPQLPAEVTSRRTLVAVVTLVALILGMDEIDGSR